MKPGYRCTRVGPPVGEVSSLATASSLKGTFLLGSSCHHLGGPEPAGRKMLVLMSVFSTYPARISHSFLIVAGIFRICMPGIR